MTNAMKDISVIIVNWNTKELLRSCVSSVQADVEGIAEIIVVDNGSSDGSQDMIHVEYPEVVLIENKKNLGFAKANNVGIKKMTRRYACLVNSDVIVLPGCMNVLAEYMNANSGVGVVGPRVLWPNMTIQDSCRKYPTLWNNLCESIRLNKIFPHSNLFSSEHMMYFKHDRLIEVDGLVGCCMMIRKIALDEVGLFDESFFIYSEETDLCKRMSESGWKIIFNPKAQIIHYGRGSSSKEPLTFALEQQKSKMKYWKKHNSKLSVIIYKSLLVARHIIRLIYGHILLLKRPSDKREIKEKIKKIKYSITLIVQQ